MKRLRYVVPFAVLVLIAAACTNDDEGGGGETGGTTGAAQQENTGTVNVLNATSADESEVLQNLWDDTYGDEVDYQVEFEYSDQFEEQLQIRSQAGTLDTILLPQPGAVKGQAATGNALSLEDLGYNIDDLNATYGEYFVSLGEFEGQHYGQPTNSNWKSLIWYPKDDFDKAGYEIPETWDELMALSDQIVADGGTPWCVGFESGTATGWPATDWVEDIMLATAGQDTYTQWVNHEIPFTDPAVKTAVQDFGDVMFHPGYVLGGADQTPSIAFGDAPLPMFDNPPGCWLHRQPRSSTPSSPRAPSTAWTTARSRSPRSISREACSQASSRWPIGTRPRSRTSSTSSAGRSSSARWGATRAFRGSRRT